MFADNEMISERQLTVQLMLSFLGPLLLVIPGQKEFGGREGIFGILLGFGAFAIYLFFLLRLAGVCRRPAKAAGRGMRAVIVFLYGGILILSAAFLFRCMGRIGVEYLAEGGDENLLILLLLLTAAWGTGKDLQRRGRLAEALFPILAAGFLLFFVLALFQGESSRLMEAEETGFAGSIRAGWIIFSVLSLGGVLPFALGRTQRQGTAGRKVLAGTGAVLLFLMASLLLLRAVFGAQGMGYKKFPMADLMAGTSLPGGFLQRLDILWITVLLLSLLFAAGSLLFYASFVAEQFSLPGSRIPVLILTGALALPAVTGEGLEEFYLPFLGIVGMPVLLVLTLCMGILGRRKR